MVDYKREKLNIKGVDMNIKSISIQGWRSYSSEEGVFLKNLKKINIIIGPNNSGKSNLFKYLFHIRDIVRNTASIHGNRNELREYALLNCIPTSFDESNTWSYERNDIICNIQLDGIEGSSFGQSLPTLHKTRDINLKAHHKIGERNSSCFSVVYEQDLFLLEQFKESNPKVLNPTNNKYENPIEGIGYILDTVEYWKAFIESMVFVDPVRHYSRNRSEFNESDFDGSDIVQEIIRVRNEQDTEWREYKSCLEGWLKKILLEQSLELDPTNNKLRFYVQRGSQVISASLENLGTGVSQLVMLLSYLYLNRHKQLNVFIEEPESNLHPEAVVQLVKILENEFEKHRFFITTHSSSLIDQVNENWSIHRVYRKGVDATKILPCSEVLHQYKLLDELGIRPSQMLQSNLVIWVEGPSDRTYLNKWIRDNSDFLEGKHYSFIMYGGSNLANYDLIDDNEYINILRTSRYSIIICDSDKSSEQDKLKERVSRLIKKVNETLFDDGRSLKEYVNIWVTSGREIENYVPEELFNSVLFSDQYLRKFLLVDSGDGQKNRGKLKFDLNKANFTPFDSFDVIYAEKYLFEDGRLLTADQVKSISNDFSKKKASIAKTVVDNWTDEHYSDELLISIADLIEHINRANIFGDI